MHGQRLRGHAAGLRRGGVAISPRLTGRPLRLALLAALSCAAAACHFDLDRVWIDQPVTSDAGRPAKGDVPPSYESPDASVAVWPDASVDGAWVDAWPEASLPSGTLSCIQIDSCCAGCSETDAGCCDTCWEAGTPSAQELYDTMYGCLDAAYLGDCATSCADVTNAACWPCLSNACPAEVKACFPDGA